MTTQRIETVIHSIRRAPSSRNGNPAYVLTTSHGEYRTKSDAALGYAIGNYTNSRFPETYVIGNPANPIVTLLATRNRVWGIEYNGEILH